MKKTLIIAAIALAVTFIAGRMILRAISGSTPPEVFADNEKEIRTYIANLQLGKIPNSPDGRGFLVLKVLGDNGATHVDQEGGYVVITFGFMPTDAVSQLWYSPSGFAPLPQPIQDLKTRTQVFPVA